MNSSDLLLYLLAAGVAVFVFVRIRANQLRAALPAGSAHFNSLPMYHAVLASFWSVFPALCLLMLWLLVEPMYLRSLALSEVPAEFLPQLVSEQDMLINRIGNFAKGAYLGGEVEPWLQSAAEAMQRGENFGRSLLTLSMFATVAVVAGLWLWRLHPQQRARLHLEKLFRVLLFSSAFLAVFCTLAIVLSVLFESILFFQKVSFHEFVFGLEWSPQTALRKDQVGASGAFGAVPLFVGTLLISAIALILAVPTGLMSAIYLAEYASARTRSIVKPMLEILAGIPTVVYGFFAALTVAPLIRDSGGWVVNILGLDLVVSSESALAAGLVMGVMIIPFVSSLSDDVISSVPDSLRDGSLGLGATKSETIKQVVIPAALPGIVSGVLLAASRAIGETMIVVMAAGLAANLTLNPLESVTTVTVQIVTLLVGDQEFDSAKTLSAFALGLMLFVVTLALNFIALHVVKKYREQYD